MGNVGHTVGYARNLHYRQCWQPWIAAKGANRASVGTEATCIQIAEEHSLSRQAVEIGRHSLGSAKTLNHCGAKTLHKYHKDVGALGVEHAHRGCVCRGVHSLHEAGTLLLGEEIELVLILPAELHACQQIERRIDGREIQKLVVAVVNAAHIGCRHSDAATDDKEQQSAHQHGAERGKSAARHSLYGVQASGRDAAQCPGRAGSKQQDYQYAQQDVSRRHACCSVLRRVDIDKN